jgi:DNA-binding MurR/RpiR family transcriptional regulator
VQITEDRVRQDGVLSSVLSNDILNISQTLSNIDPVEFESAIGKIVSAKHVYVIGVRTASMLSEFLGYNLNLICDNIRQVNASGAEEVFEQIVRIGEGDVIIGISFPRYSQRTIRALNFARDRGADVIAITDAPSSPLAQFATNLLLARSDMASFVDSLAAPMSLINALIVGVTMRRRSEIEKRLGELEQIWDEYQVYEKDNGGRIDG